MQRLKDILNEILAKNTDKTVEQIKVQQIEIILVIL